MPVQRVSHAPFLRGGPSAHWVLVMPVQNVSPAPSLSALCALLIGSRPCLYSMSVPHPLSVLSLRSLGLGRACAVCECCSLSPRCPFAHWASAVHAQNVSAAPSLQLSLRSPVLDPHMQHVSRVPVLCGCPSAHRFSAIGRACVGCESTLSLSALSLRSSVLARALGCESHTLSLCHPPLTCFWPYLRSL